LTVDTVRLDGPRDNEVLIELVAAGLCHTDKTIVDGSRMWDRFPIVLGHEAAGLVVEVGSAVTRLRPGDKVIPLAMPECGHCPPCRRARTNLCDEFFRPYARSPVSWQGREIASFANLGTFSEFITVREMQVAKIRSDAPLDLVCCMGCAGITGIGAVLHTARVEAGSSVAVFGLGGIGINAIEGARIAGAKVIIGVDVNPGKESAARRAGMTHFINPLQQGTDVVGAIKDLTHGGADYSFECVGHEALIQQAIDCTRTGWGVAVIIGNVPGKYDLTVPVQPRSIQHSRWVTGSHLGNVKSLSEFPALVDMFVDGRLTQDNLISHRIALDDINLGFALMDTPEAQRIVIDF
jgi:S-(hydroxymethyl)glutathione dehydrogenase/alcohol dehydrogenase